jgi:hypothetical protein
VATRAEPVGAESAAPPARAKVEATAQAVAVIARDECRRNMTDSFHWMACLDARK